MDLPQLEPSTDMGRSMGRLTTDRVLVAVRVRPMSAGKADGGAQQRVVVGDSDLKLVIADDKKTRKKEFPYDYVFSQGQDEIYDCIGKQMLKEAFDGFNVCLFAYGQTGSGKTYTLQGLPGAGLPKDTPPTTENEGLTPRLCRDLFSIIQLKLDADPSLQIRVTLSLTEVYNEKVRDLLPATKNPKGQEPPSLDVYETPEKRIEVKGLAKHTVIGYERLITLIQQGNSNREVAETKMNECSSRSHQILQLHVVQQYDKVDSSQEKRDCESYITLVDLAGSERQSKTGTSGEQFRESTHINQSLLMLGRALNSFSREGKQKERVPLRDSKLTRLLSESFGGNSKTWMLAAVSPSVYNWTETLSTLNYASSAKNITNHAKQNRLARALELHELKETNKGLQAALDRELAKHKTMEQEIARLEREKESLLANQTVKKEVEKMQTEAMNLKSARQRKLDESTIMTPPTAAPSYGLTTPSEGMFVGRAKISLKNIIEQTSNYHTLPLSNEGKVADGYNATLVVNIYPVDHQGSADIEKKVAEKDLLGQRVDFVVHVICAKGVPRAFNELVYCQYLYKWAEKDKYKTLEVAKDSDPEFDFKKRFAFSKMNQSLVEYFRSDSVIIFEVIGKSNGGSIPQVSKPSLSSSTTSSSSSSWSARQPRHAPTARRRRHD
eukprot:TRINITY_DN1059_c0_g2_i1.p1 TRINITY_DN1059_c0_g2~~TRINITY_DN1059_c0_g2_i1.p1  ORF type:complete len:674 (+),score=102.71 TRINITY_DN1059_c0_g2_i1:23-2023(+)